MSALTLPYPEHLGAARRAHTLSRWPSILHSYASGVLHLLFGTAFHTIRLHEFTSFLTRGFMQHKQFFQECQ